MNNMSNFSVTNLDGNAKIDNICEYIHCQAKKQMDDSINLMLKHNMVFSEVDTVVTIPHDGDHPIYKDELADIVQRLTKMGYEVTYEVDASHITFSILRDY